jgi:hypothetical protein
VQFSKRNEQRSGKGQRVEDVGREGLHQIGVIDPAETGKSRVQGRTAEINSRARIAPATRARWTALRAGLGRPAVYFDDVSFACPCRRFRAASLSGTP